MSFFWSISLFVFFWWCLADESLDIFHVWEKVFKKLLLKKIIIIKKNCKLLENHLKIRWKPLENHSKVTWNCLKYFQPFFEIVKSFPRHFEQFVSQDIKMIHLKHCHSSCDVIVTQNVMKHPETSPGCWNWQVNETDPSETSWNVSMVYR